MLGGTYLETINAALAAHEPPLGLISLGSISEQTVAGAISTATHGSGYNYPVLSAAVLELLLVCPQPSGTALVRCSRAERADLFNASLCGLGATGIIVQVKLRVEDAFNLREITEDVPADALIGHIAHGFDPYVLAAQDAATFRKDPALLGVLLAYDVPLPAAPAFPPPPRSKDAADVYPFAPVAASEPGPDWSAGDATAQVQAHIDDLVRSAQHVKVMWYPQADMVAVSRANRTDEVR